MLPDASLQYTGTAAGTIMLFCEAHGMASTHGTLSHEVRHPPTDAATFLKAL